MTLSEYITENEKILLVDDEEGIRKVLGISLSSIGYSVVTAENGEKALQIFNQINPSIVLIDIKMPGMDGIELLQKIKQEEPDTEVIMITGHGDMDLAIQSLKYNATDFVTKPINDDVLEIALKRAHEKISMRRQLKEYTENLEELVREKSAKLVKAERLIAVGQAVEGLSSVMMNIAGDLEGGIKYLNDMPCFVSIHNRDFKVVASNQLFKDRFGDKTGNYSWEIYKGKTSKHNGCPVVETFKTGKGQRNKEIIEYEGGREVPVVVHTAPIRNKENAVELVIELAADNVEVERLQEELRTTQQKYQQLFDEAPCYISVQDREFRLTATNRQFKEDFSEDIGSQCYKVYKKRNEPCSDCPVEKTFEDGESHQSEMVVTSKTGEKYNVLIWTAPIYNTTGEIIQVMEMSTNITQIRELQDRLSSLGLLISSISHGIKGLITGLDGGMYLLDSGYTKENEDQIKEGLDVVKIMADRIRNMVLDILYYAKERDLQSEIVDVLSFANDVAFSFEAKIRSQDIEFMCDFDQSMGEFEIDTTVVRSALINILENALDAYKGDESKEAHKITFEVKQDKSNIIFDVCDNGTGMDKETLENIFTLFFSSKGAKGTGLGLFISNKVIEQHGGKIKVKSTLGHGSKFSIKIPKIIPESSKTIRNEKK